MRITEIDIRIPQISSFSKYLKILFIVWILKSVFTFQYKSNIIKVTKFIKKPVCFYKNYTFPNSEDGISLAPSFSGDSNASFVYDFYKFCKLSYKIYRNRGYIIV